MVLLLIRENKQIEDISEELNVNFVHFKKKSPIN